MTATAPPPMEVIDLEKDMLTRVVGTITFSPGEKVNFQPLLEMGKQLKPEVTKKLDLAASALHGKIKTKKRSSWASTRIKAGYQLTFPYPSPRVELIRGGIQCNELNDERVEFQERPEAGCRDKAEDFLWKTSADPVAACLALTKEVRVRFPYFGGRQELYISHV